MNPACQPIRTLARNLILPLIQTDHSAPGLLRQAIPQLRVRQQHPRTGVLEHERQPLRRITHIQRQIGRPALEDPQQTHQQLRRALQAQPDNTLATHSQPPQIVRKPVRPPLQLPVSQPLLLIDHRHGIRTQRRLPRKTLVQTLLHRIADRTVVPLPQYPPLLHLTQQGYRPNSRARIGQHLMQERREAADEALYRAALEQVCRVLGLTLQIALGGLIQLYGHVELRCFPPDIPQLRLQPCKRGFARARAMERKQHLEQRVTRKVAVWFELLHQLVERNVLVRVGLEHRRLHLVKQAGERQVLFQIRTQHQRVHKQTDQPLELTMRSAGDRRPHQNVREAGPTREQRLKCR